MFLCVTCYPCQPKRQPRQQEGDQARRSLRPHWLDGRLKKIVPKLLLATKIDAQKHEEVAELKEKGEEIERLETALAKAQEENAELEKLKNKEDVKALKQRTSGSKALQQEFDELIAAVDKAKPKANNTVLRRCRSLSRASSDADRQAVQLGIDWCSRVTRFSERRRTVPARPLLAGPAAPCPLKGRVK